MRIRPLARKSHLASILMQCGLLIAGGPTLAADKGAATPPSSSDTTTSAPPALGGGKPIPPSTAEQVDSAFKKLALDKGYVTKDDVRDLQGFDAIFDTADKNHDGRLNFDEFRPAWKSYTASDKANRG